MLTTFFWTFLATFLLYVFIKALSVNKEEEAKGTRKNRPHIKMLDCPGEDYKDEWYTKIAGAFIHAKDFGTGSFYGWVESEPDNPHDRNAMAIYTTDGEHMGYIPADELTAYREWCECDPMPCIGVIYRWNGKIYGKVKVLKPCNAQFLDDRTESFLDWIRKEYGPDYLPKNKPATISVD